MCATHDIIEVGLLSSLLLCFALFHKYYKLSFVRERILIPVILLMVGQLFSLSLMSTVPLDKASLKVDGRCCWRRLIEKCRKTSELFDGRNFPHVV